MNQITAKITAKIIADSIADTRITTMELSYHRYIHSEFMTHRVFSRNASSSRAIPVKTLLEQVRNNPMMPVYWGSNKPGMQAGDELTGSELYAAQSAWLEHARTTVEQVEILDSLHLHKQIANRLLEPFLPIKVVVTSTEWDNFFTLRDHKDAQPEIQELAKQMKIAMANSTPELLKPGQWHLPYLTKNESENMELSKAQKCSAARCARVSYLNHDKSDCTLKNDLSLFSMLATRPFNDGKGHTLLADDPVHLSPLEHQATPGDDSEHEQGVTHVASSFCVDEYWSGNFRSWIQFRQIF